ncbi:LuxR family transcriptional regulator [Lonsdalea quercina]|uniref:LuxR family transcriptional regulator n=1 Tax=Lonsdalea quercina TaxID=71657 RepID=UPI003F44F6FF
MDKTTQLTSLKCSATSLDDAFDHMFAQTLHLGFDRVIYDYAPVPRTMEGKLINPSLLRVNNVPEDMPLQWFENGFFQMDVVQHHALETCAPFVWSYQRPERTPLRSRIGEEHKCVTHYMRENGMPCGATVPLHLPRGGFATVTAILNSSHEEQDISSTLSDLTFIAHRFQESAFPLFSEDLMTCQYVHLTKRERECLAWSAEGLTAKEIARKLNRSVATVTLHLNNATKKLGANNRVQAVVRAMYYHLLDS